KVITAVPGVAANDPSFGCESVKGGGKNPLRLAELGIHWTKRFHRLVSPPVNIPPAGTIRNKVEVAVRRPFRLEDRLVHTSGDSRRFVYRPVSGQFAQPKLRTIPRHVGMVPSQPSQPRAIRTKAWRGVKIMS